MFEELIGKNCRIQKNDGYIKFGRVLLIENGYLKFRLPNGTVEFLLVSSIVSISEVLD
jgi:hypothetical protein